MSTALPPEIIADVLWRLPVKSLLRFRCTSKPLCSMIDDPDFTNTHLNGSKHSLVLTSDQLYSIDLPSLERAVQIEHQFKTIRGNTKVIDSCNGLLCFSNNNNSDVEIVVLWNISNAKHHRLPYIPIKSPALHSLSYGFGYDSVHDDYKVVRMARFDALDTEIMIYSLKSNSWKRAGALPYRFPPLGSKAVFAGGAIHWLVAYPEEGDLSTVAFDLATEDYRLIQDPPYAPHGAHYVQMRALEGRLCVTCSYAAKPTEIWVLKHDKSSWDKLLSISVPHCIVPMVYLSNGTQLVLLQDDDKFLIYDLKTNKVRNVRVRGTPPSFHAVPYVESLVNPSPMANATVGNHKNVTKRDDFLSKGFKLVL